MSSSPPYMHAAEGKLRDHHRRSSDLRLCFVTSRYSPSYGDNIVADDLDLKNLLVALVYVAALKFQALLHYN